ncbi:MAG: hypothetical protein A2V50_04850 [Bacteroidetes bacterium RBG_19FT_COMBO_42_10]|nr:MAG: hypothetical protein A2V50_04850 [Bacteroidetes bacterium RBG_19FT_COMBO_42_10]
MNKFNRILLLLLNYFLICLVPVNAQQLVIVNIQHPPFNQLTIEDMWKLTLINTSTSTYTVYLTGTLTESQAGLIATGLSTTFDLPPGTKVFTAANYKQLDPSIKYVNRDRKYEESVIRTGGFSSGEYEICVSVIQSRDKQELGLQCIQQSVLMVSPPILISPENGEEIKVRNPNFLWTPVTGVKDVQYKFKLVEVFPGQSLYEAMKSNSLLYSTVLRQTTLTYSPNFPELQKGKEYAWQVQSLDINGNPIGFNNGLSEIAGFKFPKDIIIIIPPKVLPDTLIAAGFKIAVESWDSPSKSLDPTLPSGLGRINFNCAPSFVIFPWEGFKLFKKKFFVVQTLKDSVNEFLLNEAQLIKADVKPGEVLELEMPGRVKASEMIMDKKLILDFYKDLSPKGIRVAFRDVKWNAPTEPVEVLTEGFAWYPTIPPIPVPPAVLVLSSGFKLEIDSLAITPDIAKVKGNLCLPKNMISTTECTCYKLPVPLTEITPDCEFYVDQPDSSYNPFFIGETDIIVQGEGFVIDFSSTQSPAGVVPPLADSWKGVLLRDGETVTTVADSVISNRGYVKASYSFTNAQIISTGMLAKLNVDSPFEFHSLDPFGYQINFESGFLNIKSSKITDGEFNDARIALPLKAIRNQVMARVLTGVLTLKVQPDMDLFGDVEINSSLVWGEYSITSGQPKFYQIDHDPAKPHNGNFYLAARWIRPYYPVSGTTWVNPSFVFPIDSMLEDQRIQGVTIKPINHKKFTIWTKDLPASDTLNGLSFPKELVMNTWLNVIRTGVHAEVFLFLKTKGIDSLMLGPTWSDMYLGVKPFNSAFDVPLVGNEPRFMRMQFVESAVWDADFKGYITLGGGINDTVAFYDMMFTSTANNAGGKLDLSTPAEMEYWGVQLVPKDPSKSAGVICVKLGVIYLTAAGIYEPRHYAEPFYLTWGEIKASGDLGRLFFDYNNVGQRFDRFYYTPHFVALSPYAPPDSGYVHTSGSLSINFFGAKILSISDYKSTNSSSPFDERNIVLRSEAHMDSPPSDLHWTRSWAGEMAFLDFNMVYDSLIQDGFLGIGFADILGITGNLSASIRVKFEGSCFSIFEDFAHDFGLGPLAYFGAMGNIWGCGCIKGESLEKIVIGGELSSSAGVGASILARMGSLVGIIFSYEPTRTMLELNGDLFIVIAEQNIEATAFAFFVFDRGEGYVEGHLKGTIDMGGIVAGVSGEGELQWHIGLDYHTIQGKIAVEIFGFGYLMGGGVGVETGLFLGLNAPKEKAWVMDGISGKFGLNKNLLPAHLTGFYAFASVKMAVNIAYIISGGYQVYTGLGAFVDLGSFALVGNVGVKIWGSILGGLVSASAWGNLQLVAGLPNPGFEGAIGLEACVLWVACGSVDVHCGYNNTDSFYIY